MEDSAGWPEPVVRVQSLSESGAATVPGRYVKPERDRPSPSDCSSSTASAAASINGMTIPVVDLSSPDAARAVSEACREWGFFQAVNHGVPRDLIRRARAAWRGFFHLPAELKQRHANSPATYEGYGSRLGVERGAVLDWGDYYFLHLRPPSVLSPADKWPLLPPDLREATEEYGREVAALCGRLLAAMSTGLGVGEGRLQEEFGGTEGAGVCVRVNYYPRCPQPELTLGLSSHSDPGGMTVLLADERVRGLQVRARGGEWVTVDPVADAFIVNVGDQIQILSHEFVYEFLAKAWDLAALKSSLMSPHARDLSLSSPLFLGLHTMAEDSPNAGADDTRPAPPEATADALLPSLSISPSSLRQVVHTLAAPRPSVFSLRHGVLPEPEVEQAVVEAEAFAAAVEATPMRSAPSP